MSHSANLLAALLSGIEAESHWLLLEDVSVGTLWWLEHVIRLRAATGRSQLVKHHTPLGALALATGTAT